MGAFRVEQESAKYIQSSLKGAHQATERDGGGEKYVDRTGRWVG